MLNIKIGYKFNKWTVLEKTEERSHKNILWKCKCECGNISKLKASVIKNNLSKGCRNCANKSKLKKGEACFNDLYGSYKRRAKKKQLEFNLSKEDFKAITSKNCYYCGKKPSHQLKIKYNRYNGSYIYNSIDRINNSVGYIIENCIAACGDCNKMRNSILTVEEMKIATKAILKYRSENI